MRLIHITISVLFVVAIVSSTLAGGAGTILLAPTRDQYGIIERDVDGNIQYSVLIADHIDSDRGYATMGGTVEGGEDPRDAAARETEQESRGKYRRDDIRNKIENARAIKKGNFIVYVVIVDDLIHEDEIESASMDCEDCGERYGYKWIPLSELDKVVMVKGNKLAKEQRSEHSKTDYLFEKFVRVYNAARKEVDKEVEKDRNRRSQPQVVD